MVYGLGLGSIATVFGKEFNEQHYKTFNKVTRRLGLLPWKIDRDRLLNTLTDHDEKEAVKYYFSPECKEALEFAKGMKKQYFQQLPAIDNFLKRAQDKCRKVGWVKTWTGRRRRFRNKQEDAYKAPNSIIQGGCGDILKSVLPKIQEYIDENQLDIKIVNLIHDEVVFECSKDLEPHIYEIKKIMEIDRFSVPMGVDISYSDTNWAEKEDM